MAYSNKKKGLSFKLAREKEEKNNNLRLNNRQQEVLDFLALRLNCDSSQALNLILDIFSMSFFLTFNYDNIEPGKN